MKRVLCLVFVAAAGPLASLVACEGEPPVVAPENPSGAAIEVTSASATPATAAAPSPSDAPTACPPPPCAPATSSVASGAAPPAASAGSPETPTAAVLPVPPASVPRGNIVGTVTIKPATMAGQAVVYLEDGPLEDQPGHLQNVTIANQKMNFIPFVSVAAVGAKIVFSNEDPFPHNVFSPDNERFNMGNIPQNGAHVRTFKSAGAYTLLCNLHPGMLGYLLITPSPFYARTDAKGRFMMKHVPSGTYKATAWAPRLPPVTQSVAVAESDVTTTFDLHR